MFTLNQAKKFITIFILLSVGFMITCGKENTENSPDTIPTTALNISDSLRSITIELPNLPDSATKLEMILIEPDTFTMGTPENERGRSVLDWEQHRVKITQPFYLGKFEITQAQWEAVMGKNSHRSKNRDNENLPVEKISWKKSQKFIRRLNKLKQGHFRLPTEAEWEYSCRAGTKTRFSFGDSLGKADKYMWWSVNNTNESSNEVGQKLPNPWGLFDMHGNVSEWCSDLWEEPKLRKRTIDPQGPEINWLKKLWSILPPGFNHVFRGGSFEDNSHRCRSGARRYEQAYDYHYTIGLRVVRDYP